MFSDKHTFSSIREFQAIAKELCEKNELLKKHSCRIEQLEQEIHVKNKQCKELLRRLKRVTTRSSCQSGEEEYDEDDFDECDVTVSYHVRFKAKHKPVPCVANIEGIIVLLCA